MEKRAESGTAGIPRRAFNNPRALESLGSSNLSNSFTLGSGGVGSVVAPSATTNFRAMNQAASQTGVIYVTPQNALSVSGRSRSMTPADRAAIRQAVRAADRRPIGSPLPAIAVPYNSFLEARQTAGGNISTYRTPRGTGFNTNSPLQTALRSQRLNRQMRSVPDSQIGD